MKKSPKLIPPTPEEDVAITREAMADDDNPPLTDEELAQLRPVGRPRAAVRKVLLSMRYSPEVIRYFKSTGPGWQTRMDEALKQWMKEHTS